MSAGGRRRRRAAAAVLACVALGALASGRGARAQVQPDSSLNPFCDAVAGIDAVTAGGGPRVVMTFDGESATGQRVHREWEPVLGWINWWSGRLEPVLNLPLPQLNPWKRVDVDGDGTDDVEFGWGVRVFAGVATRLRQVLRDNFGVTPKGLEWILDGAWGPALVGVDVVARRLPGSDSQVLDHYKASFGIAVRLENGGVTQAETRVGVGIDAHDAARRFPAEAQVGVGFRPPAGPDPHMYLVLGQRYTYADGFSAPLGLAVRVQETDADGNVLPPGQEPLDVRADMGWAPSSPEAAVGVRWLCPPSGGQGPSGPGSGGQGSVPDSDARDVTHFAFNAARARLRPSGGGGGGGGNEGGDGPGTWVPGDPGLTGLDVTVGAGQGPGLSGAGSGGQGPERLPRVRVAAGIPRLPERLDVLLRRHTVSVVRPRDRVDVDLDLTDLTSAPAAGDVLRVAATVRPLPPLALLEAGRGPAGSFDAYRVAFHDVVCTARTGGDPVLPPAPAGCRKGDFVPVADATFRYQNFPGTDPLMPDPPDLTGSTPVVAYASVLRPGAAAAAVARRRIAARLPGVACVEVGSGMTSLGSLLPCGLDPGHILDDTALGTRFALRSGSGDRPTRILVSTRDATRAGNPGVVADGSLARLPAGVVGGVYSPDDPAQATDLAVAVGRTDTLGAPLALTGTVRVVPETAAPTTCDPTVDVGFRLDANRAGFRLEHLAAGDAPNVASRRRVTASYGGGAAATVVAGAALAGFPLPGGGEGCGFLQVHGALGTPPDPPPPPPGGEDGPGNQVPATTLVADYDTTAGGDFAAADAIGCGGWFAPRCAAGVDVPLAALRVSARNRSGRPPIESLTASPPLPALPSGGAHGAFTDWSDHGARYVAPGDGRWTAAAGVAAGLRQVRIEAPATGGLGACLRTDAVARPFAVNVFERTFPVRPPPAEEEDGPGGGGPPPPPDAQDLFVDGTLSKLPGLADVTVGGLGATGPVLAARVRPGAAPCGSGGEAGASGVRIGALGRSGRVAALARRPRDDSWPLGRDGIRAGYLLDRASGYDAWTAGARGEVPADLQVSRVRPAGGGFEYSYSAAGFPDAWFLQADAEIDHAQATEADLRAAVELDRVPRAATLAFATADLGGGRSRSVVTVGASRQVAAKAGVEVRSAADRAAGKAIRAHLRGDMFTVDGPPPPEEEEDGPNGPVLKWAAASWTTAAGELREATATGCLDRPGADGTCPSGRASALVRAARAAAVWAGRSVAPTTETLLTAPALPDVPRYASGVQVGGHPSWLPIVTSGFRYVALSGPPEIPNGGDGSGGGGAGSGGDDPGGTVAQTWGALVVLPRITAARYTTGGVSTMCLSLADPLTGLALQHYAGDVRTSDTLPDLWADANLTSSAGGSFGVAVTVRDQSGATPDEGVADGRERLALRSSTCAGGGDPGQGDGNDPPEGGGDNPADTRLSGRVRGGVRSASRLLADPGIPQSEGDDPPGEGGDNPPGCGNPCVRLATHPAGTANVAGFDARAESVAVPGDLRLWWWAQAAAGSQPARWALRMAAAPALVLASPSVTLDEFDAASPRRVTARTAAAAQGIVLSGVRAQGSASAGLSDVSAGHQGTLAGVAAGRWSRSGTATIGTHAAAAVTPAAGDRTYSVRVRNGSSGLEEAVAYGCAGAWAPLCAPGAEAAVAAAAVTATNAVALPADVTGAPTDLPAVPGDAGHPDLGAMGANEARYVANGDRWGLQVRTGAVNRVQYRAGTAGAVDACLRRSGGEVPFRVGVFRRSGTGATAGDLFAKGDWAALPAQLRVRLRPQGATGAPGNGLPPPAFEAAFSRTTGGTDVCAGDDPPELPPDTPLSMTGLLVRAGPPAALAQAPLSAPALVARWLALDALDPGTDRVLAQIRRQPAGLGAQVYAGRFPLPTWARVWAPLRYACDRESPYGTLQACRQSPSYRLGSDVEHAVAFQTNAPGNLLAKGVNVEVVDSDSDTPPAGPDPERAYLDVSNVPARLDVRLRHTRAAAVGWSDVTLRAQEAATPVTEVRAETWNDLDPAYQGDPSVHFDRNRVPNLRATLKNLAQGGAVVLRDRAGAFLPGPAVSSSRQVCPANQSAGDMSWGPGHSAPAVGLAYLDASLDLRGIAQSAVVVLPDYNALQGVELTATDVDLDVRTKIDDVGLFQRVDNDDAYLLMCLDFDVPLHLRATRVQGLRAGLRGSDLTLSRKVAAAGQSDVLLNVWEKQYDTPTSQYPSVKTGAWYDEYRFGFEARVPLVGNPSTDGLRTYAGFRKPVGFLPVGGRGERAAIGGSCQGRCEPWRQKGFVEWEGMTWFTVRALSMYKIHGGDDVVFGNAAADYLHMDHDYHLGVESGWDARAYRVDDDAGWERAAAVADPMMWPQESGAPHYLLAREYWWEGFFGTWHQSMGALFYAMHEMSSLLSGADYAQWRDLALPAGREPEGIFEQIEGDAPEYCSRGAGVPAGHPEYAIPVTVTGLGQGTASFTGPDGYGYSATGYVDAIEGEYGVDRYEGFVTIEETVGGRRFAGAGAPMRSEDRLALAVPGRVLVNGEYHTISRADLVVPTYANPCTGDLDMESMTMRGYEYVSGNYVLRVTNQLDFSLAIDSAGVPSGRPEDLWAGFRITRQGTTTATPGDPQGRAGTNVTICAVGATGSGVAERRFYFGDGNYESVRPAGGTAPNCTVAPYNLPGIYYPRVVDTTTSGATKSTEPVYLAIRRPPEPPGGGGT